MTIMGNGELEKMTRAGWDLVTKTTASEHAFLNEYLVRGTVFPKCGVETTRD